MPPKNNKDSGSPLGDQLHQLPWLILGVVMMLWILATYLGTGVRATEIPYSEFKAMIRQEAFQEVILGPTVVRGTVKAGTEEPPKTYEAVRPEDPDLLRELEAHNVRYRVEAQNPWMFFSSPGWCRFSCSSSSSASSSAVSTVSTATSWPSGAAKRKSM
jgi:ATP-dependent Zn protease